MNLNRLLLPLGVLSAALFSACAPLAPNPDNPLSAESPEGADGGNEPVTSSEQKKIREGRESAGNQTSEGSGSDVGPPAPPKPPAPKTDYPRGVPIPGKDGFVFNPYNNNPVDVRGIPPGTLVIDPQDPDQTNHKFRVP